MAKNVNKVTYKINYKDYVYQVVERIKDLDIEISKLSLQRTDKRAMQFCNFLKQTRRSNYMLYRVLTNSVYAFEEQLIQ